MMLMRLAIVICAAVTAAAVLPQTAAAQNALPSIDLQARCRKTEKAMIEMMGSQFDRESAFQTCMRGEQDARDALLKSWPDIPANYKAFCVRKNDYSPSYIEWISCLELMIDLRKQRATSGNELNFVSKGCPSIEYGADGSIKRVKACPVH
jgi:hypothetical protein